MSAIITPPKSGTAGAQARYLPVRDFFGQMAQAKERNPYSSAFSFVPFIEKMKAKKVKMQEAVPSADRAFIDEMEKSLIAYSDPERLDTPEKRQEVVCMLFPSLFFEGQLGFVAQPFTREFFYMTPGMQEIFNSTDWEVKVSGKLSEGKMSSPALEAGKLILKTFYGRRIRSSSYSTLTFRHKDTLLEKHFKVQLVMDYIKTTPLKELKKLDEAQLDQLLNNWNNEPYWLQQFPPGDFVFEGLVIGYIEDVTEAEVLSQLKEMMLSDKEEDIRNAGAMRQQLRGLICTYLQMPDLEFGYFLKPDFKYSSLFSWSLLGDVGELSGFDQMDFQQGATYGLALGGEQAVTVGDLRELENPTAPERRLLELGYRSLLLSPQKDKTGQTFGVLELVSRQPYAFNRQILEKLGEVISLYAAGTNRWIQLMDNNVNFFIQKQFTYIHPSVEWKFLDVSQKYIFCSPPPDGRKPSLQPIVFKDVFPLYGQSDIVGSSQLRNRYVQADLLDNLHRVQEVIRAFRKRLAFQLLDVYLAKTEAFSQRLETGGYISSDESQIVELLTQDIHPLLRELSEQYGNLPKKLLRRYLDYLDPKLDIVYRERKDYEDSVQELNDLISAFIENEVTKKQEVLPHFFEKYITDGVEYNIYLGQSILQQGRFSQYFLRDFRLWQLILMCEVTRLVEKHGPGLLVPLATAQLVFIYNTPLSIRFNMDEKQFDVDGAYNVRYEILKKRIDKAVVKGSGERLTQRGKVAMVWLQDKDRVEYLEYIDHLRRQGFITGEVEELELERLQGADGLKALRVTVAL